MTQVKSPYNFVPAPSLGKEVFIPKWAKHVSHDIPFSDGVSGELQLRITACTPIFIRNGQGKKASDPSFSHISVQGQKRYFIPATSLKGMLRSVLEIISRSKMKYINDHRHAVRQIMRAQGVVADEDYRLTKEKQNIYAGYLVKSEGDFYIYPCGKPYKIRYTELDKILPEGRKFEEHFKQNGIAKVDKNDEMGKTGRYKYEKLLKDKELEHRFSIYTVEKGRPESWVSKFQPLEYVRFADEAPANGVFWGRIVCTGQATTYDHVQARKGEYVFEGRRADVLRRDDKRIKVDKAVMYSFLHTCRDGEHDEVKDWSYWKEKLKEGVPIFFRYRDNEKKEEVRDFGLTFMYKEPVRNSIAECLTYDSVAERPDFVETLLGYVEKSNDSLRGRTMISHAFAVGNIQPLDEREIVLATPKSSYYPFYLKQSGKNGKTNKFNTYNYSSSLRGYKRYPVRNSIANHRPNVNNEKLISEFQPLPAGTIFVGKIRFHNLKPAELGGLLSALTFHGQSDQYYHTLGGAKPFGYGRVKIEVTQLLLTDQAKYCAASVEKYLDAFACEMKNHDPHWHESDYWQELLAMANLADNESSLSYMELEDFNEVKKEGFYLQDYSSLTGFQLTPLKACADPNAYAQSAESEWQRWETIKNSWLNKYHETQTHQFLTAIEKAIQDGRVEEALDDLDALSNKIGRWTEMMLHLKKAALIEMAVQEIEIVSSLLELDEKRGVLHEKYSEVKEHIEEKIILKEKELRAKRFEMLAQKASTPFEFGKDYSFDSVKKVIKQKYELWNKINDHFTEDQLEQIEEALRRSIEVEFSRGRKSKFHRHGKLRTFSEFPWTDIQKWLGIERAKNLFSIFLQKYK